MDKYELAHQQRQSVLDHLNANPGAPMRSVMLALDVDKERAAQILLRMEQLGEVSRVRGATVSHLGRRCAAWYALVGESVTADDIKAHLTGNLSGPGAGRKIVRVGDRRPTARTIIKHLPMIFGGLTA